MGGEKMVLLLAAVILSTVESCTPSYPPSPMEVILSQRYGLVALDAVILDGGDAGEGWEWVRFRFEPRSFYRPRDLEQLGNSLIKQLEGRGWSVACKTLTTLPVFGGPYFVVRVRRGSEGAGILLRLVAGDIYRLEIGPTRPDPRPFDCRHRDD